MFHVGNGGGPVLVQNAPDDERRSNGWCSLATFGASPCVPHEPNQPDAHRSPVLGPPPSSVPYPGLSGRSVDSGNGLLQETGAASVQVKWLQAPSVQTLQPGLIGKTSIFIHNIPCRVTQDRLVATLAELGFDSQWDFLYLPNGGRSGRSRSVNLGYGIINFRNTEACQEFAACFQGFRFTGTNGRYPCTVRPARKQGRLALMQMVEDDLARAVARHLHNRPIIRERPVSVESLNSTWCELGGVQMQVFHF